MSGFLTPEQIEAYKHMHKKVHSFREGDRIKSILLLNRRLSYEEVAELLSIDDGKLKIRLFC